MTLGGVVGFGVLAVVLLACFSLVATLCMAIASRRLRRAGPVAERSAAAWALFAPVVLALATVLVLALHGSGGAVDHCLGHDDHAHLCFAHGAAWLDRPWAIAVAAASAVTILLRLAGIVARRHAAWRAIAQVRRVAEERDGIWLAPSERVFCFVWGWRKPEVFASTRAWEALSHEQRRAVVAHERAHAEQGDLWLGLLVDVATLLAAPLASSWLRAQWTDAGERLCDLRAADATAPETVASALVRMFRAGQQQPVPSAFTAGVDTLEQRVTAVLGGGSAGQRLGRMAWAALVLFVGAIVVLAGPLHHALETLLG